ncbi:MAG TPA: Tim44-like domain-containing protein [Kofleriaceae bacterium]|nr:Tim44-like domain-containing protein [Kofleriaceae bacterium]
MSDGRRTTDDGRRTWTVIVVALAIIGLLTTIAWARPGGGESFSGGGGHGGGGGGGGGDVDGWLFVIELIIRLIYLCVVYPYIGLPLVGLIIVALIVGVIWNARNKDWNSGPPVELAHSAPTGGSQRASLTQQDPDFSWVLFEDFAFRLFATAHEARGDKQKMEALAPYVNDQARAALVSREPAGVPVMRVIVGALRVFDTRAHEGRNWIGVEYEANYTAGGNTWYTVERWGFTRNALARTKPPRLTKDFPCPNCGAPWQSKDAGGAQQCAYCNEVVDNGRFDWQVVTVDLRHADPRPPTLTHEVPERGNKLPTYKDPNVGGAWQHLLADDPALQRGAFDARVDLAYKTLNDAWAANDLRPARAFVSDGLYDYLSYWITAYSEQGLRNALVDMRITQRTLAKVSRDRWYDAVTVRIWARGKDYVVDRSGKTVRGSASRERPYSEYWTFIRSSARRGPASAEKTCPNCGAPLSINMAGACAHCSVHVTAGEFDWVLSKIEQDDTYRG